MIRVLRHDTKSIIHRRKKKTDKLGIIKIQKVCYAKDHYKRLRKLGTD